MTLEQRYLQLCRERSDIRDHLPVLRRYASEVDHVTEFGTRTGRSLCALLAGQPRTLVSYDIQPLQVDEYQSMRGDTDLIFRHGPEWDTTTMPPIDETDLLFIDTRHTGEQVEAELDRHGDRVRRFLVFHDTETFGRRGEGGGEGLLPGIRRWRDRHAGWQDIYCSRSCHGLLILEAAS